MKSGDIALVNNMLVEIVAIEYKSVSEKKLVGKHWLFGER